MHRPIMRKIFKNDNKHYFVGEKLTVKMSIKQVILNSSSSFGADGWQSDAADISGEKTVYCHHMP